VNPPAGPASGQPAPARSPSLPPPPPPSATPTDAPEAAPAGPTAPAVPPPAPAAATNPTPPQTSTPNQELIKLSAGVGLPQTGPEGYMVGFSVDYEFTQGTPNTVGYVWVIERAQGTPAKIRQQLKQQKGNLHLFIQGWRPEEGPFQSHLEDMQGTRFRQRLRCCRAVFLTIAAQNVFLGRVAHGSASTAIRGVNKPPFGVLTELPSGPKALPYLCQSGLNKESFRCVKRLSCRHSMFFDVAEIRQNSGLERMIRDEVIL